MSDIDFWAETQRIIMANLPTVHRSNYVAPDMELVLDMENDFEPGCQSVVHDSEPRWHGGDAAFMQIGPCEKCTGLRCAQWVHLFQTIGRAANGCDGCGSRLAADFKFIPLDPS